MVFSSFPFILAFLPITWFVYFGLQRARLSIAAKAWLLGASLFFYAWWRPEHLVLLVLSLLVNFSIGTSLAASATSSARHRKPVSPRALLVAGIVFNLGLLGFFKYAAFAVTNLNLALDEPYEVPSIVLPLAISFFTFQQIAYLVDSYRGLTREPDFLNYGLFVCWFPQLIAGPIVHHAEMMPQFASRWNRVPRHANIARGLVLFSIGLFKKIVVADTFAQWANAGYAPGASLDMVSGWVTSLSYSFQLYFDFSGYCDMAIGAALLFNIRLPANFLGPYQSTSIQEFWRRWHITLGRFLRDYLYVPLGGSRRAFSRTSRNLMITFILGGLWHGASWMFVVWGALHGIALVIHRAWSDAGFRMPLPLAWLLTFLFVNVTWVFFRATSMDSAFNVLTAMVDIDSLSRSVSTLPTASLAWGGIYMDRLAHYIPYTLAARLPELAAIALALASIVLPNSMRVRHAHIRTPHAFAAALMFAVSIVTLSGSTSPVFLYFNF